MNVWKVFPWYIKIEGEMNTLLYYIVFYKKHGLNIIRQAFYLKCVK